MSGSQQFHNVHKWAVVDLVNLPDDGLLNNTLVYQQIIVYR